MTLDSFRLGGWRLLNKSVQQKRIQSTQTLLELERKGWLNAYQCTGEYHMLPVQPKMETIHGILLESFLGDADT